MTNPSEHRTTPFAGAGVWISAPAELTVTLTPVTATPDMMAGQPDFQPIRIIGNLKFQNKANPDQTRFTFDPPARLQARFNNADAAGARQRGRRLVLAWWNGQRWIHFAEGSAVLAPGVPLEGGDRYFDIPALDDPPISWGT